jgi:hypothetical protein
MVKGITYLLKNDATFQARAGQNAAGTKYKVYPGVCPEPETVPYSVVKQTGKVPIDCKGSRPTSYQYSYDVISFHNSYDRVEALDDAVVDCLSRPEGETVNADDFTVEFSDIRHTNTRDEIYTTQGSTTVLYAKVSSFEAQVEVTDET